MKTRVIVGLILTPLLFIVLYFTPPWVLPLAISVVSVLAVHELLGVADFVRKRRIMIYSLMFTACVPIFDYFDVSNELLLLGTFCYTIALFTEGLLDHDVITYEVVGGTFMASILIPTFFCSVMHIFQMKHGEFIVLFAFIIPMICDIFAMLTGILFGKHKLIPEISPKKTVEGSIGGVVGSMFFSVVYGLILRLIFGFNVNFVLIIILAFVGSIVGQIGDLTFSYIKRGFKVKDFGAILPGHGGILDRFDSLMFVAPLVEVTLVIFKIIWR